ncbi:hypothetical protein ES703_04944 [subsurface metagenome]
MIKKDFCMDKLLKKYRFIGVVGNSNTAKTSLVLHSLIDLKERYPDFEIFVFGVVESLNKFLISKGIKLLHNKEDVLDLKLNNCLIYIDEFADLFSVQSRDKQFERIRRFFNRIHHLNNWFILSTAQANFYNKFVCGIIKCYLVKEIEYENLVNGTILKRKVLGLSSSSDYRFECSKNTFLGISDLLTEKHIFPYIPELDSKINLINPFKNLGKREEKADKKGEEKVDKKGDKKGEEKGEGK